MRSHHQNLQTSARDNKTEVVFSVSGHLDQMAWSLAKVKTSGVKAEPAQPLSCIKAPDKDRGVRSRNRNRSPSINLCNSCDLHVVQSSEVGEGLLFHPIDFTPVVHSTTGLSSIKVPEDCS